ncbi:MAG: SPOR domain-containing protein [Bacteroidales bacterium]|uniref:SPOR domain-containing protein n=1 Tax=Porphyromonas sp. TaxID=1924944 RepID=UPI0029705DFA|nr:SPOR domain-containing protein [Porphyromonas sp.]MDD7438529.1 SPOR domain-containing protein [Bacteroidales bacterium]MDY3067557.1 SPOR domain-containing protein [Porphyromonas sp.]
MKKVLFVAMALLVAGAFTSCKPKQSAYKAVMERAQQREIANAANETPKDEIIPVIVDEADVRPEKVTAAQGEDANNLKRYSVVIGSFQNVTNARALRNRMSDQGYNAILAQNEQGMYRVIVTSFDDKVDAVRSRESIKSMFAPQFQDAWILERTY